MNIYIYLALMIGGGMLFGRIAKLIKLPNVTGYLIAGLLLGPSVFGLIPSTVITELDIISDIALGSLHSP